MQNAGEGWHVLFCAPQSTLTVEQGLRDEGVRAWVPSIREKVRPSRVRRAREVSRPIMPGFVFVASDSFTRCRLLLLRQTVKARFFMWKGDVAAVSDAQLDGLRNYERLTPAEIEEKTAEEFSIGEHVIITEGIFAHKNAVVTGRSQRDYLVDLQGIMRGLKISALLLRKKRQ